MATSCGGAFGSRRPPGAPRWRRRLGPRRARRRPACDRGAARPAHEGLADPVLVGARSLAHQHTRLSGLPSWKARFLALNPEGAALEGGPGSPRVPRATARAAPVRGPGSPHPRACRRRLGQWAGRSGLRSLGTAISAGFTCIGVPLSGASVRRNGRAVSRRARDPLLLRHGNRAEPEGPRHRGNGPGHPIHLSIL